jgi:hypothetical protein
MDIRRGLEFSRTFYREVAEKKIFSQGIFNFRRAI